MPSPTTNSVNRHRSALGLEQLGDGLLAVFGLDKHLTEQRHFIEELLHRAFGDLFDHRFRLAGFAGFLDGNPAFALDQIGGNT
jgi:hypothetical protein